jgi:hypothetical protein
MAVPPMIEPINALPLFMFDVFAEDDGELSNDGQLLDRRNGGAELPPPPRR